MRLSLAYRRFSPNHSSIATQISSPIGPISFLPSSRNSSAGASRPLLSFQDIPAPHLGSIRILSLNSPHNRNAISQRLLSDLKFQIDSLAQSGDGSKGGIRALIIASTLDNVFCAGADLKERKGMSDQECVLSLFLSFSTSQPKHLSFIIAILKSPTSGNQS